MKGSELRSQQRRSRSISWISLGLLASTAVSAPARAEPDSTPAALCVTQAERAQEFYQAGDVAQARAEVALCAQDHCPALVRNDCQSWLQAWDQPVAANHPVTDEPAPPVVERPVAVESAPAVVNTPASEPAQELLPSYDPPQPPVWPWIAAAVGMAGGAGFAYWGLSGRRDADTLAEQCGRDKSCSNSQVDPVREKLIFADISLGVGLVAVGAAIWGFATHSTQGSSADDEVSTHPRAHTSRVRSSLEFSGSSLTARFRF